EWTLGRTRTSLGLLSEASACRVTQLRLDRCDTLMEWLWNRTVCGMNFSSNCFLTKVSYGFWFSDSTMTLTRSALLVTGCGIPMGMPIGIGGRAGSGAPVPLLVLMTMRK